MDWVPCHSSSAPAHLPNKMTTTKWAIGVATLLSPVSIGSHIIFDDVVVVFGRHSFQLPQCRVHPNYNSIHNNGAFEHPKDHLDFVPK